MKVGRIIGTWVLSLVLISQSQAYATDLCYTNNLLVMGPSWHSKATGLNRFNNDTFGLGIGCGISKDWNIYAGAYRNSFHDTSLFLTGVWKGGIFRDLSKFIGTEVGLGFGLVNGYNNKVTPLEITVGGEGVSPVGFLNLRLLQFDKLSVGALVVPPGEKDGAWAINLNMQVDF